MRKGFTLVELILVLGIMIAIGAIVFASLASRRSEADLAATTQQVATLLRQAQSDAVEQQNGAVAGSSIAWGVHFSNATNTVPFYALFTGSYSATATVNYYPLPTTLAYQTSTLASGATLDVIFSPITGASSVSTSIGFYMPKQNTAFSSTISIASSGQVSY
jgi:type II secretory pathway pseudopilin PulG